jgi:hypothetical protein
MTRKIEHSYTHEQLVQVEIEPGQDIIGKVLALLPHLCQTHNSPMYGCECGGAQFSTCEEIMQPLSTQQKRKLN